MAVNLGRYAVTVSTANDTTAERYRLSLTTTSGRIHIRRIICQIVEPITTYYGSGVPSGDVVSRVTFYVATGTVTGGTSADIVSMRALVGVPSPYGTALYTTGTGDLTVPGTPRAVLDIVGYEGASYDFTWGNNEFVLESGRNLVARTSPTDAFVSVHVEWCEEIR